MSGFDENNVGPMLQNNIGPMLQNMNDNAIKMMEDEKALNTKLIGIHDIGAIKEFIRDYHGIRGESIIENTIAKLPEVLTSITTAKQMINMLEDYLMTMNAIHTMQSISIEILDFADKRVVEGDQPSGGGSKTRRNKKSRKHKHPKV